MRLLGALLAALLGLMAAAAGQAAGQRLVVGLPLEPPNLDPTSGAAAAIDQVTYHTIFEGLTTLGPDGTVRPLLATRWDVSSDLATYVFHLRPGVRFHDGEPLDAAAVAFALRRAGGPDSTNAQRDAFARIRAVEVIDPLTVRVRLVAPDAAFLTLLSYGDAVIVPPRAADALATRPIGTGPFRFAGWRRGDLLTLARAPAYWGRPARLGEVAFRFIVDPTAAYAAMRARDVDLFVDYPAPETLERLRADPGLRVVVAPSEGEVILAMNERRPALADIRVRRAIARAVDRRALVDGAMYGYGIPIGSHFPPQSPDYVDLTALNPHDPARARELLARAGHARGLTLRLALPPPPYARRGGEIIAAELAAVGVRVVLEPLEWAQWLDRVHRRHDYDLTVIAHVEPFDYDIYGRPGYYFGYGSAAYDGLLATLRRTADPAGRHALLQAIQRRLAEDAPNAFLFQLPRLGVQDARLTDVWINTPNQAVDLATARFTGVVAGHGTSGAREARNRAAAMTAVLGALLLALAAWQSGPRYVAGRALALALTLLAATALIFLLVQVAPGDPAAFMMGTDASPAAVAALHAELGLEGPAWARYGHWLAGMARGDLGLSYTYRVPVAGLLAERMAVSLPLALCATALSLAIGLPAGYLAATRGGAVRGLVGWAARIGIAVPNFWLAILLTLLFSVTLHWAAAGGFPGWQAGIGPALGALALPAVALGTPQAAVLARVFRSALAAEMTRDYIGAARAKGLSRARATRRHAVRNALGPVAVVLGLQVPFLLAGAAIVEAVFFLPGLGRLALQAITQRDLIVVQGVVLLLAAMTVLASFAADLLQRALDPRLRGEA